MKQMLSSFESTTDSFIKVAGAAVKFCIAMGCVCVLLYSIRVGHFPQGLTLGDGLLFLIVAGCFGFLYIFFVAGLIALGCCFSPLIRQMLRFCCWVMTRFSGRRVSPNYKFAPFKWNAVPFALMAIVMIIGLGDRDYSVYLQLLTVAVIEYVLYSCAVDVSKKLRAAKRLQNSVIEIPDKAQVAEELINQKNIYYMMCLLVMILPLLVGGVSGKLMDSVMRLANVRIEHPVIYAKTPYNELLPESLIAKNLKAPEGYKAYEGISVRFKGVGNTTVLVFKYEGAERQLEVPNDKIIVEKKSKNRI